MVTKVKELAFQPKLKELLAKFLWGYGSSAPVDGSTGAGSCPVGGLYVHTTSGTVYRNGGTKASPTWLTGVGVAVGDLGDDTPITFGSGDIATLTYDSTEKCIMFTPTRPSATDPAYAYGQQWENTDLFTGTGAVKAFGLYLTGGRDSAILNGDAHDMQLKVDYVNEAVNVGGCYARGLSCQMNNKTTGVIGSLQGGFIGVRQRSTAACPQLLGLQIDVKVDAGKLAPSTELTGLRVEMDLGDSVACAASYGVVVRNRTDGANGPPTAAFKAYNDGTTSCKGFLYGLDLMSSLAIASGKTVVDGDIRFSQKDANELPCVLFTGTATSDGTIVTDVGADTLWADGCLYISVVDSAGKLFQKQADTWIDLQA